MIKYFCDKCGKQLENYDIFTVEITPPEIRQWEDNAYTADPFILCRNCMKSFHVWIAKKR